MKVVVTGHAIDRFRERFRLRFHKYCKSRPDIASLIIGQVSTAHRLDSWKSVPFYANKVGAKYGTGVEIFLKSGVYYLCVVRDGTCSVRTVHHKALFYPDTRLTM